MIRYGKQSRGNIAECCQPIREVLQAYAAGAPEDMDLTIIVGFRGEAAQNAAHAAGNSGKRFPDSKHNKTPSEAFDFIPSPFSGKKDWGDALRFSRIAGGILYVARQKGVTLRWGGDWDRDGRSNDQKFMDLGHIEYLAP